MTPCPDGRCDGSGFLFDEEARRARPCSCRPKLLARKRAAAIQGRIPKRFRGVSFDRQPLLDIARTSPEPVRRARRYVQTVNDQIDAGRGIWFTGTPGTGKTTLAMLISAAAIEAGRSVAIYSLPHLLAVLRNSYNDGGPSLVELIDRLAAIELLHIDDIGAEQNSPWVLEQLYTIINARYENERALILTTNLVGAPAVAPPDATKRDARAGLTPAAPPTLEEQLGDRTVSRIYEMCGEPLGLFGPDHRKNVEIDPDDVEINYAAIGSTQRQGGLPLLLDDDAEPSYGEPRRPRFAS
jgi:DNA replication protein DnaC